MLTIRIQFTFFKNPFWCCALHSDTALSVSMMNIYQNVCEIWVCELGGGPESVPFFVMINHRGSHRYLYNHPLQLRLTPHHFRAVRIWENRNRDHNPDIPIASGCELEGVIHTVPRPSNIRNADEPQTRW